MAFENTPPASAAGSRYLGEGFRLEPDFRDGATTLTSALEPAAADDLASPKGATRVRSPNLDYVFDDPDEGEPGPDRMLVHGVWELVLASALAGMAYLLYRQQADAFGHGLRPLMLQAAMLGTLAVGSAVALRAAMPNLAIGALAVAAALYFGQHSEGGLIKPLLVVVGVAALIGLVQGAVVVGLHVPAWAASLGVALILLMWSTRQAEISPFDGYDPSGQAFWWFGVVCVLSLGGGLLGLVPTVRRGLSRFRPVADPAHRRGLVGALIAVAATVVSCVCAGIGGILLVSVSRAATPSDGLELTALAIGVALVGGTSAFGRRGGVAGTVLATGLMTVTMAYARATDRTWRTAAFAVAALVVGLAVTRLVERFGRPAVRGGAENAEEDWAPRSTAESTWPGGLWQGPPAPASNAGPGGIWSSEEAWGSR
jgi:ribose/xylose/arabinose/galactoside ABC-type transport system permease subunit